MTDEQIKQWARAAGLANQFVTAEMLAMFRRMCEFAAAAEREACLAAIDDVDEPRWYGYENPYTFDDGKRAVREAIRARGKP